MDEFIANLKTMRKNYHNEMDRHGGGKWRARRKIEQLGGMRKSGSSPALDSLQKISSSSSTSDISTKSSNERKNPSPNPNPNPNKKKSSKEKPKQPLVFTEESFYKQWGIRPNGNDNGSSSR